VKKEGVRIGLLDRGRAQVKARDAHGQNLDYTQRVEPNESILTGLREPHLFPQLSNLRQEFLNWRFYHHFRTDRQSPLRKPQLAVATAVMAHDGSDFVSALGTILEMGNGDDMIECLEQAFPGSNLLIAPTENGMLRLSMSFPDINRPLDAAELSDGTLQYLCLLASVFSLRPPSVLAINEPETSIHPSLFEPMAKMLKHASADSQIWITTHSREFADLMLEYTGCSIWELEKVEGETRLVDVGLGGYKEEDEYEELPD
jgi:predicted ATPase